MGGPSKHARKRTAGHRTTATADTALVRLRRLLFRPWMLLLVAAALSSTFLVPTVSQWIPSLTDRSEYVLRTEAIEMTPAPAWIPQDLVHQVIARASLPETLSVLDAETTRRVAEAFQQHPWVARVVRVQTSYPARVTVELEYRTPVGMVRVQGGMYPVDGAGVLLPPDDFSAADTEQYPTIENVTSTPQGAAGTEWGDPVVEGAARLAQILQPHWNEFGFRSIRAPRRRKARTALDELVYGLVTEGGSYVIWGRAPGTDYPGELSPKQKIGRLQKYLADFGRFDGPAGPYEIDIRHWQEISRRPLATSNTRIRR